MLKTKKFLVTKKGGKMVETKNKMERYSKHIILKEIGKNGQKKLLSSKIAIIGCGALGTHIANNMARAGVGRIIIVDRDFVEIDNLQRQILFDEEDAVKRIPKVMAAKKKLKKINSEIEIIPIIEDVNPSNIENIIKDVDLVIDATDNLETRFLINDACIKNDIPWIYGAVIGTEGMSMNILPGKTACLRCFLQMPTSFLPTCETEGVLNTAVAIIASIESTEAIKILLNKKIREEAIYIDIWNSIWLPIKVEKKKDCIACGKREFEFLNGKVTQVKTLCGNAVQINPTKEILLKDLYNRLKEIVDVIDFNEYFLRFKINDYEFTVFKNGRTIIKGCDDEKLAKSLFSKYIGS